MLHAPQTAGAARIKFSETLHPAHTKGRSTLFEAAKAEELAGLLKRGACRVVHPSIVPADANILSFQFVLAIKGTDTAALLHRARFVVQRHRDRDRPVLPHNASAARSDSLRFTVSIAAKGRYALWSFDVTEA